MSPHGLHNAIIQTIGTNTSKPQMQLRCAHCQQMLDADLIATVTYAGMGVVWHGCYGCLAAAHRRGEQMAHAATAETRQLLARAYRIITQPADAAEIDAVCAAIERAVHG